MFPGFETPFTCIIAGPSQCGKTVLLKKILKGPHLYMVERPTRIVWACGVSDPLQNESIKTNSDFAPEIEFVDGLPDIDSFSSNETNLLILDDLMLDAGRHREVAELFTKNCHHRNISCFFVVQNMFHKGQRMRDIQTSSNYMIIFKNPRDNFQINFLDRQCFPQYKNYLTKAYNHACQRPFGCLLLDFKQSTQNDRRLMTGIFPNEKFFYYPPPNISLRS